MSTTKKINEMSASGAAVGAGAFPIGGKVSKVGRVFEPKTHVKGRPKSRNYGKGKGKKKQAFKDAVVGENKSERTLREAIRNLIFLNRVKYHEENAKKEMQEQKIRKIIRYLLKEADSSRDINFSTTGAASAWNFITAIEKTTFTNDFATTLKSSKEQREAFKVVYLTGVKIYLDALDQQYMILNPEDKPGMSAATDPNMGAAPDMGGMPPAKRGLDEQGDSPTGDMEPHPTAAEASPPPSAPLDTSPIQTAAVKSALSSTQQAKLDKTGVNAAESALNRDLPQIDPLYFNLTFKPITTSSGRNTNDRQEFRFFLIGDKEKVGNIQLKFKEWEDKMPIGGQNAGLDTPKLEPSPLNLPDISGGASAGGDMSPAGGTAPAGLGGAGATGAGSIGLPG